MSLSGDLGVDGARLAEVCRRYGVARLRVFGSVARGSSTPTSDVDVLYELLPGHRLGWEIEDLADELAELLGRRVDLVSATALHPSFARQRPGRSTATVCGVNFSCSRS